MVALRELLLLLSLTQAPGFTPSSSYGARRLTKSGASLQEPPQKDKPLWSDDSVNDTVPTQGTNADGLPWWWELVWKLDIMKRGEPGQEIIFGDSAHVLRTNIEQIYGGYPSLDGCPIAEGRLKRFFSWLWGRLFVNSYISHHPWY